MSIPVITISREYGSGGRAIGEKLAKELGIPFYNKELILMAAKESGLSEEYIKKAEQQKSTSFLYGLYMGAQQLPMNDQIFLIQSKIIREIAEKGPCVIVGRCADYVLRERKDLLSVFIHAPLSFRAQRAQKVYEKTASNIEDFVKKKDKKRAAFYNYSPRINGGTPDITTWPSAVCTAWTLPWRSSSTRRNPSREGRLCERTGPTTPGK